MMIAKVFVTLGKTCITISIAMFLAIAFFMLKGW